MAKQPSSKGGVSRIRFIMLDAEIPEGDLSQITAAIQNALKPTTTIIQQRLPAQSPTQLPGSTDSEVELEREVIERDDDTPAEPPAPKQTRARKSTVPKVLEATSKPALPRWTLDFLPE